MKTTYLRQGITLALAGGLASCAGGTGQTPPSDQLFFPVGIVADPGGEKLYVSNGNFNTRFDGGTVVALDLALLELDGLACRQAAIDGAAAPEGCQLRPGQPPTLCQVDAASGACRASILGLDPALADEAKALPYIDKEATVEVASFAGDFAISPQGDRLYLPVRGDQSLTLIDIDGAASGAGALSCEEEEVPGAEVPHCSGGHVLLAEREGDIPEFGTIVPGFDTGVFGVALDPGRPVQGAGTLDLVYVTHLDTGAVSLFRLTPGGDLVFQQSGLLAPGVNQIAIHPLSGLAYIARRDVIIQGAQVTGSTIEMVRPRIDVDDPTRLELESVGSIDLGSFGSGGTDYRALAFGAGGARLYVGQRDPSSVVVIDTSLNEFGQPKNQIVGRVDVDPTPEQLEVVPLPDGGELLYVADFDQDRVHVIDPLLLDGSGARTAITVGGGPFGMAFVERPGARRLFVANFDEDTLSVIDVDPQSPSFNQVLYRVGAPRPAEEE